mmetsp:Transcript_6858/g.15926  ORF Transcript_6858/g.15926 Transcript_6858/m.15926 type:complete len:202 (+) Transcript_6858:264-869(+)
MRARGFRVPLSPRAGPALHMTPRRTKWCAASSGVAPFSCSFFSSSSSVSSPPRSSGRLRGEARASESSSSACRSDAISSAIDAAWSGCTTVESFSPTSRSLLSCRSPCTFFTSAALASTMRSSTSRTNDATDPLPRIMERWSEHCTTGMSNTPEPSVATPSFFAGSFSTYSGWSFRASFAASRATSMIICTMSLKEALALS